MIDSDALFKLLLSTCFTEFIELFFPEMQAYLDDRSIEFLDKEFFTEIADDKRREADLVVKARFLDQDSFFIINIENQGSIRNLAEFQQRIFFYFAYLHQKFKLPVYTIIVLYGETPKKPIPSIYRVELPDRLILEFHYAVVHLNRLDWRAYINHDNPLAGALMTKMNFKAEERPFVKLECLRAITKFRLDRKKMRLLSSFIDTYLNLTAEEEAIFQKEVAKIEPQRRKKVMELTTSWEQRGIAIGEKRGEKRGKQLGTLNIVKRLLRRQIGVLPAEVQDRLETLSVLQLEKLAEAIFDFTSIEDVLHWLNRMAKRD